MRKFLLLAVLGGVVGTIWTENTAACGRRRRAHCYPCYVTVACPTAPRAPRPLHMPPLATETLRHPSGRTHQLHTIDHTGWQEPMRAPLAAPLARPAADDTFNGSDREAAKTSVSMALTEPFADLAAVVATLPDDGFMRDDHVPPISKDQDSGRVQEEERNVTVTAYLVATKKENDNDFHLILATTPDGDGPYLTAEVSGLPRDAASPDRAVLLAARGQYRAVMDGKVPGSRYKIIDPPLAVAVTGSLFFDMDHVAGVVGTGPFKPATSWEIHPVTSITFAP
jgi:hypothetical protein